MLPPEVHHCICSSALPQGEGDLSTGDRERLYSLTGDLLRLTSLPLHIEEHGIHTFIQTFTHQQSTR